MFATVYYIIRAESGQDLVFKNLKGMVSNDVIREYATDHGVFAPVEVDVTIDVLPDDECPSLEAGRPPNLTRIFHIKHT